MAKDPKILAKRMMYLCAINGIVSLFTGILAFYMEYWICAAILLLIALRQIIVFPKWIKKLK